MWAGGGWGRGAALHHKKVLPILGILSTDATNYLSRLLSFQFIFGLRHMEGKLPKSLNESQFKKKKKERRGFYLISSPGTSPFRWKYFPITLKNVQPSTIIHVRR